MLLVTSNLGSDDDFGLLVPSGCLVLSLSPLPTDTEIITKLLSYLPQIETQNFVKRIRHLTHPV